MANYRISLNVVRKANANMRRNRVSSNTQGGVAKGEVVVSVNTGTFSKRIVLSNNQIKAAYKKAVEAYAEKI